MKIVTLPLGSLQTNTYLVWREGCASCLVIDPADRADAILSAAGDLGLTIEAVLLTHGHFDHVGAVKDLAADTGCRVFLNPAESTMPPQLTAGTLYYTDAYQGGEELQLAGLRFSVLHTPGHTPGSVCLLFEKAMFSGDTLFQRSCRTTDLPGGNSAALKESLKTLRSLPRDYTVYPGHGPATTLEQEKAYNPYF